MPDREQSESTWQDAIGFIGIALAVAGLWDTPPLVQLSCFAGCVLCLLISFTNQSTWPVWVRWILSLLAVTLIALMSASAVRKL